VCLRTVLFCIFRGPSRSKETENDDKTMMPLRRNTSGAKQQPWRLHLEHYTLFKTARRCERQDRPSTLGVRRRVFTPGLSRRRDAARVVGVDLSPGMIELARREEERAPLGIDYLVHDVKQLALDETFDIVVAAYLLNYAQTAAELVEMGAAIRRHLKPGGRFVTVNNNPRHDVEVLLRRRAPYGFIKRAPRTV